jgi:hypothetical protein
LKQLIAMMVAHDIGVAQREQTVNQAGFTDAVRGAALGGGN